jgi:hypothetical protein
MKKILIILLLIIPTITQAKVLSSEEWVSEYIKPCKPHFYKAGIQCFDNTKAMLMSLSKHRRMITKYLRRNKLPIWLGTIPIIESRFGYRVVSPSGAIGLWQLMPSNIMYFSKVRFKFIGSFNWTPNKKSVLKKAMEPKYNTKIACKMIKYLYSKYSRDDRVKKKDLDRIVVMAYNAGETRINKWLDGKGKPLKPETMNYYEQLMAIQMILEDIEGPNSFGFR